MNTNLSSLQIFHGYVYPNEVVETSELHHFEEETKEQYDTVNKSKMLADLENFDDDDGSDTLENEKPDEGVVIRHTVLPGSKDKFDMSSIGQSFIKHDSSNEKQRQMDSPDGAFLNQPRMTVQEQIKEEQ